MAKEDDDRKIRRKLRHDDYVSEMKDGRRQRAQTFRDRTKYNRKKKHPKESDDA